MLLREPRQRLESVNAATRKQRVSHCQDNAVGISAVFYAKRWLGSRRQ